MVVNGSDGRGVGAHTAVPCKTKLKGERYVEGQKTLFGGLKKQQR